MLLPATYICPHCAQASETSVDPSQGATQSYVEDCQVCCRPLILQVGIVDQQARIDAVPETE
jgi:hypothetical protein